MQLVYSCKKLRSSDVSGPLDRHGTGTVVLGRPLLVKQSLDAFVVLGDLSIQGLVQALAARKDVVQFLALSPRQPPARVAEVITPGPNGVVAAAFHVADSLLGPVKADGLVDGHTLRGRWVSFPVVVGGARSHSAFSGLTRGVRVNLALVSVSEDHVDDPPTKTLGRSGRRADCVSGLAFVLGFDLPWYPLLLMFMRRASMRDGAWVLRAEVATGTGVVSSVEGFFDHGVTAGKRHAQREGDEVGEAATSVVDKDVVLITLENAPHGFVGRLLVDREGHSPFQLPDLCCRVQRVDHQELDVAQVPGPQLQQQRFQAGSLL